MKIKEVQTNSNATLEKVEVVSKGDVRTFDKFGKSGRVCNCVIKDDSGEMELTLWNDEIDAIEAGQKVKITDGWVKEWNGKMQISAGKNGKIEKI
ncbi:MAG: DNA-binding protein [Nanoarchaeota archaeon]|nr:DNA-binding protein [Nanoarchaeota archaeon]MBU1135798.1 DNA-binding protein [Nanoarchaeota archaeon]MBU2519638.1 DNA-binding protein [Nanoarchaeota archaeon]